jgi:cytochrome b561
VFGDRSFAGWIDLGAKLAHVGLYLLLLAVPLVGIAVQFARGNPLPVFGLLDIASPWPADRAFARSLKEITNGSRMGCWPWPAYMPRRRWCITGCSKTTR